MPTMVSKHTYAKRRAYQLGFKPTNDPLTISLVAENPSRFYALWLGVVALDFVPTTFHKNGEPWKDYLDRPLDEAFFLRWKTPDALSPGRAEMNILKLKGNGVRLVVDGGDRIEIAAKRIGGDVSEFRAVLVGFVEESGCVSRRRRGSPRRG